MRHHKKSKKAVIEVGFSWIFILIAGAVILGLFAYIGINQGNFFRTMFHSNLLTDLNSIFIGAMVSKDTAAIFNIPTTTLNFGCNSYSIEGISHPVEGRLVFGPNNIKTSRLITWSKPWSLGYRITNMLYITSPYVKYIIAFTPAQASFAQEIYDDLPSQLSKELVAISGPQRGQIKQENYEKVVVMVLGLTEHDLLQTDVYDPSHFKKNEVTFLYLLNHRYLTDTILTAKIMFKNTQQQQQSFNPFLPGPYTQDTYDISSVYGAFISGDQENWQCLMERAYSKAKDVSKIYWFKADILRNTHPSAICSIHYSDSIVRYQNMHSDLGPPVEIGSIPNHISWFNNLNIILERASCPLLY
jgi:hypothetical protein